MDKTKRIACILFVVAGAALVTGLVMSKDRGGEEEAPARNVYAELPEAEETEIPESKSQAYMRGEDRKTRIEDYWDECLPDEEMPEQMPETSSGSVSAPKSASTEELLGLDGSSRHSPAPNRPSNPYRETTAEREARHQRRHEEALELAERIQKGQSGDYEEESESSEVTQSMPSTQLADVRRSDAISSMDDWGSGLSSLDEAPDADEQDQYTPFRCMFARDSKLTDGQRVTVILLDDLTVSGISVPRNTHLMATCHLSSRLELEFANIEIGGRILGLGFEAYDIDGSKGIYCPDAGSAGKTVKNRGTDIIGSSLSGRLGRVAREVTSTGIALIQSADGQRTVSVPAGYTFFIVKKKLM